MAKTKIVVGNWTINLEKFKNSLGIEVAHSDNSVIYDIFDGALDDNQFQERFTTEKIEKNFSENGDPADKEIHIDSEVFAQFNIRFGVDEDEHLNLWIKEINSKDITQILDETEPTNFWQTTLKI